MSGKELQVAVEPPGWASNLPDAPAALHTFNQLAGECSPVEALLASMDSSSQRRALMTVHQHLVELGQQKEVPYGDGFQALLLQAGTRCVRAYERRPPAPPGVPG